MRVKSLKTVDRNYCELIKFLEEGIHEKLFENIVLAQGFLKQLKSFEFYFLLKASIMVFERIEALNEELQKVSLSLNESNRKICRLLQAMQGMRETGFPDLWEKCVKFATDQGLEGPRLSRARKPSRRIDYGTGEAHAFDSSESYYRKIYYEIVDQVISSLKERFDSETMDFLNYCEDFLTDKDINSSKLEEIFKNDFDYERLELHRDMFLDIAHTEGLEPKNLKDVVTLLKSLARRDKTTDFLLEFVKLVRILLTVPVTTCTAERSLSVLRILKNYLRSTMNQNRFNHLAIIYVYHTTW